MTHKAHEFEKSIPGVSEELEQGLGGRPLGELLVGAGAGGGVL